jgi:hypothetical protein
MISSTAGDPAKGLPQGRTEQRGGTTTEFGAGASDRGPRGPGSGGAPGGGSGGGGLPPGFNLGDLLRGGGFGGGGGGGLFGGG